MPNEPRKKPHQTDRAKEDAALRRERLAAALRDNLKKRKAQARARAAEDEPGEKG
jgi:hypothetical protein